MTSIKSPDGTIVIAPPRAYARASVHRATPEAVEVLAGDDYAWLCLDGAVTIWPANDEGDIAGHLATLAAIGRAITAQAEARLAEVVA